MKITHKMVFVFLPPEIRLLILTKLSDAEAFRLYNLFPELKDWSFWRQRARDRFQVPRDYFDLALDRQISGLSLSGNFNQV